MQKLTRFLIEKRQNYVMIEWHIYVWRFKMRNIMKHRVCQKSFYLWAGSSRHISTLGLQCLFPSRVSATLNGASFSHLASLKLTMVVSTWVISSTVCNQIIWKANCVQKIGISTWIEPINYNYHYLSLSLNRFDRALT